MEWGSDSSSTVLKELFKKDFQAWWDTAQWLRMLATKPDDLFSAAPGTQMVEEETDSPKLSSDLHT